MAKKSTVKTKDIINVLIFLGMIIKGLVFLILLPFKMVFLLIDHHNYKREYAKDIVNLKDLMARQQVEVLEKANYPLIALGEQEELHRVYSNVQWLEERVVGYTRRRTGFRISNHGFYLDDSQTKQESIKDLVRLRNGDVYITHKRLVMLGNDDTVKEIKYNDINHISAGKRTLLVTKKNGGKPVVLRFDKSIFTIRAIILSLMERPVSLPAKVIKDLDRL